MTPVKKAINLFGSRVEFAKALGVSPQAVIKWERKRVPAERVSDIVEATKGLVTKHDLRPDIFSKPHAA